MKAEDKIHEGKVFDKIDWQETEVLGRKFIDCTFRKCKLNGLSFVSCHFTDCVFEDCDLSLLKVKGSFFSRVEILRSKAIGIHWFEAGDPFSVQFSDTNISYSSFFGKTIKKPKFKNCVAKETDFSECVFIQGDFAGSDLTLARFSGSNLTQADFSNASGYYIDFAENRVTKAKFSLPEALNLLNQFDIIVE